MEKTYSAGATRFVLNVPQLDIERGARIALIGESGSGKSTLLELLALILIPGNSSTFTFRPLPTGSASNIAEIWRKHDSDRLSHLRSHHIGYVLQHGGLLPYLSVRENICLPRELLGMANEDVAERPASKLGIRQQLDKLPNTLSVGQRQRAAIARALAHDPPVVIADEPTAAIDPLNAERIMALLVELANELQVTLILASHAQSLMRRTGFELIPHEVSALDEHTMTVTVSNA